MDRTHRYVYVPHLRYAVFGLIGGTRQRRLGVADSPRARLRRRRSTTCSATAVDLDLGRVDGIPWNDLAKGQRKDDVTHQYLNRPTVEEGNRSSGGRRRRRSCFALSAAATPMAIPTRRNSLASTAAVNDSTILV